MKPIHVTFDEVLLKELDADPEVKRVGRSMVLRRAVSNSLSRKRRRAIAEPYRQAYGREGAPELDGWSRAASPTAAD